MVDEAGKGDGGVGVRSQSATLGSGSDVVRSLPSTPSPTFDPVPRVTGSVCRIYMSRKGTLRCVGPANRPRALREVDLLNRKYHVNVVNGVTGKRKRTW